MVGVPMLDFSILWTISDSLTLAGPDRHRIFMRMQPFQLGQ